MDGHKGSNKAGKLLKLSDYVQPWKQLLSLDGESSTLMLYGNPKAGSLEFIQQNDANDSIRTTLFQSDVEALFEALECFRSRASKNEAG